MQYTIWISIYAAASNENLFTNIFCIDRVFYTRNGGKFDDSSSLCDYSENIVLYYRWKWNDVIVKEISCAVMTNSKHLVWIFVVTQLFHSLIITIASFYFSLEKVWCWYRTQWDCASQVLTNEKNNRRPANILVKMNK